ncbi:MAG: hypothetical protein ACREJU_04030 [Nitrospiraceae bacterium]
MNFTHSLYQNYEGANGAAYRPELSFGSRGAWNAFRSAVANWDSNGCSAALRAAELEL